MQGRDLRSCWWIPVPRYLRAQHDIRDPDPPLTPAHHPLCPIRIGGHTPPALARMIQKPKHMAGRKRSDIGLLGVQCGLHGKWKRHDLRRSGTRYGDAPIKADLMRTAIGIRGKIIAGKLPGNFNIIGRDRNALSFQFRHSKLSPEGMENQSANKARSSRPAIPQRLRFAGVVRYLKDAHRRMCASPKSNLLKNGIQKGA